MLDRGLCRDDVHDWFKSINNLEAEDFICSHLNISSSESQRVFKTMCGELPSIGGYIDFEQYHQNIDKHLYILPKDKNKYVVWSKKGFDSQKTYSVKWFLSKCRCRYSDDFLKQSIDIISSLSLLKIDLFNFTEINKKIPKFTVWLDSLTYDKNRLVTVTYLSILLLEYNEIMNVFPNLYLQKIEREASNYAKSTLAFKRLSRQICSKEFTRLVNICMEFDLLEDPLQFLEREWNGYPLIYFGVSKKNISGNLGFELAYRIACQLPIDFSSILEEKKEQAKMPSIYGFSFKLRSNNDAYWASGCIKMLVDILIENTSLTYYEILKIISGNKRVCVDSRGKLICLKNEEVDIFICLNLLGLHPYRPSKSESKKMYGSVELSPGFCLGIIDQPHIIHFISQKKCQDKSRIESVVKKISSWNAKNVPLLTIWWDRHLNKKVTPSRIAVAIKELANKKIPLAMEIYKFLQPL